MIKFIDKMKLRLKDILNDFKKDIKYFSNKLAIIRLLCNITSRGRFLKKINSKLYKIKHRIILDYLSEKYNYVIEKYKNEESQKKIEGNKKYIWVCWWQGEDKAPEIVKKCIDSIKINNKEYEVVVISNDNFKKYVYIPEYILDKVDKGMLTFTFLSDVIRTCLLCNYGGLWLDATIYCNKLIPEFVFERNMFTCKKIVEETNYISNYRWTSFVMGCKKEFILYKFLKEFFFEYCKNDMYIIDYLLVDYIICLAYDNIKSVKEEIDNMPITNNQRDDLVLELNKEFKIKKYEEIIKNNTYLFKLTWKEKFYEYTVDGKPTFYHYFLNDFKFADDLK